MTSAASRNVPGALDRAVAIYRAGLVNRSGASPPAPSGRPDEPPTSGRAAERGRHFAAATRLAILEPVEMTRLHLASRRVRGASSLSQLLPAVLDGAMELTGADSGDLQLIDPAGTALRIVTSSGLSNDVVEHVAVVDDRRSTCGLAVRLGRQIATRDFLAEPAFAAHRQVALAAGFRAVLSTPLLDFAGNIVGVVSTYFRAPELPDPMTLRLVELLADLAGEQLADRLAAGPDGEPRIAGPPAHVDADLAAVARLVIYAVLSPGGAASSTGSRPAAAAVVGSKRRPFRDAFPTDEVSDIADLIVSRLLAVSLRLDGARSVLTERQAADRLLAVVADIEALIDDIRTAMVSRARRRDG